MKKQSTTKCNELMTDLEATILDHVSKNCANLFLSELCQILADCEHFWHKDSKANKLFWGVLIFHFT